MTDAPWLSDHEQQMWRAFVGMLVWVPAELEAQLQRDAGLTHFGYWVMVALSEAPHRSMRMSDLAGMVHGSQSRLSHVVGRLERQGWVRRERAADDGRGSVAMLTGAGYDKVVASASGHVAAVRSLIFDTLSPEQVDQLADISRTLLARIASGTDRRAPRNP